MVNKVNAPPHGGVQREASSTTPLLGRNREPENTNAISGDEQSAQHIDNEWEAEDNPNNPRNFTRFFKWTMVTLVSFIEFLT